MDEQTQATIPPKATPVAAPGAPRPITVRLKPIAAPAAPAATPGAVSSSDAATVRLRPVILTPATTAQILPPSVTAAISAAQVAATVQAAKSKTSRISLDSAIGVATSIPMSPTENATPKTIRLKRPTDLATPGASSASPLTSNTFKSPTSAILPPQTASKSTTAPIRQTSRIPDSAIPAEAMMTTPPKPATAPLADSSMVTQKKTLRIRRPGAPDSTIAASTDAEGADGSLEGIQMMPISEIEGAPQGKGYKVFSVIAIITASAAAILMIALNWCLAADAIDRMANKNTAASIPIDAPINWPGKFAQ